MGASGSLPRRGAVGESEAEDFPKRAVHEDKGGPEEGSMDVGVVEVGPEEIEMPVKHEQEF